MSKSYFDTFWDQSKTRFGGFSSLNMRDEANLKNLLKSLIQQDLEPQQAPLDYEKLGMVMYCAVKAALSEVYSGTQLQTSAKTPSAPTVQEVSGQKQIKSGAVVEELPSAFFQSTGTTNMDRVESEKITSTGVSDSVEALRSMKGTPNG